MKKATIADYTIEIDPDLCMGSFGSRAWLGDDNYLKEKKQRAEDMIEQIRRHVDGAKYATIIEHKEFSCSYCGSTWTEDNKTYNNGCCEEDEKNREN